MRIFFDPIIVGSQSGFVWDDGKILVNDGDPCDWHFSVGGKRAGCVRAASDAAGLNLVIDPVAPQVQFWKKHTQHPAWHRILPRKSFTSHLVNQVEKVVEFLNDSNYRYFHTFFQVQQSLIDSLVPGRVRDKSLVEHGFVPDEKGFISVPVYDNQHSATGRMSITAGPKILTLQKDLRSSLISRWDDGVLIGVDFNSLEARVLNWVAGNSVPEGDLYEWIGKTSGACETPRHIIKESTLSAIYGMSKRNFALRYQDMPDAVEVYESVRSILKVRDLEEKIKKMPRFVNEFGRPLPSTTAQISYYIQSSAVDVACHGFKWLVDKLDPSQALPVFIIHDEIVIDVKKEYLETFKSFCDSGVFVSVLNSFFPVKIRRFCGE